MQFWRILRPGREAWTARSVVQVSYNTGKTLLDRPAGRPRALAATLTIANPIVCARL